MPNAPGRDNGTRDNYVASGSETFNEDSFNVRIDGRIGDGANTFGRYSRGKFLRDGPTAFGAGGGRELVSLGGVSDVRNQSLAVRRRPRALVVAAGRLPLRLVPATTSTCCRSTSARRRRPTRAFPGLNLDKTFTSGLPAVFIATATAASTSGRASASTAATARSTQDEKQWQMVGNVTKICGQPHLQVRRRTSAAPTTCACRATPTAPGELTFDAEPHARLDGRRPRAGDLPARRRHQLRPLRQHEHRRARAAVAALLLRAGHLARHARS